MIKIKEQGRQISEHEIIRLESEFGARLPNDYRLFLLQNNGGIPSPDTIDVPGLVGSPTDVQVFFGIGRSIESSDLFWNLRLIADRYMGLRVLPIACDSGGDLFCLQISEDRPFKVVYCGIHDPHKMLYEVASDFSAFLNKIRE